LTTFWSDIVPVRWESVGNMCPSSACHCKHHQNFILITYSVAW
jgi:hypothetical protein